MIIFYQMKVEDFIMHKQVLAYKLKDKKYQITNELYLAILQSND